MSMWQPFTEKARQLIVRTQEATERRGETTIEPAHILLAAARGDDALAGLVARSFDIGALEKREPSPDASGNPTSFSQPSKRVLERSFEHAQRLGDNFIGASHIVLALLDAEPALPLLPNAAVDDVRASVIQMRHEEAPATAKWVCKEGLMRDPFAQPILAALSVAAVPGTRVTVSVEAPGAAERRWVFERGYD